MKRWTHVKNVSGLDIYIIFDDAKIYEITSHTPENAEKAPIPDRFAYISEYLTDHTKQPMIPEAMKDFDLGWTTEFQMRVYKALSLIPCGTTASYKDLAVLAGSPGAFRAVGSAMGKNRFLIALPCHRIIASGHRLGGFSSGLENKRRLLISEGIDDF